MVVLTNLPPPSDGIRHQQPETKAFIESRDLGPGILYVAESRLSWVSNGGQGFSLEYPGIALHAVSRDRNIFPHECLYLMIDAGLTGKQGKNSDSISSRQKQLFDLEPDSMVRLINGIQITNNANASCVLSADTPSGSLTPGASNGLSEEQMNGDDVVGETDSGEECGGDESGSITEIRFVPQDPAALDPIFQSMADCQALHPDENDSFSEDECEEGGGDGGNPHYFESTGVGDFFSTPNDIEHLTPEGRATLERLNASLVAHESQQNATNTGDEPTGMEFEDAEDDNT